MDQLITTETPAVLADAAHCNGVSSENGSPTAAKTHVARAEQLLDRATERLATAASHWKRGALWLGTRTREELQSIWAEAQSIHRGKPQ